MAYLISINNNQSGPYSLGQLKSMIAGGQITLDYWICRNDSGGQNAAWMKIEQMPEVSAFFSIRSDDRKLRHGFTSFVLWLFLLIYGGGALTLFGLYLYLDAGAETMVSLLNLNTEYGSWSFWINLAWIVFNTIAVWEIIDWGRSGFYGFIVVNIIAAFLDPANVGAGYTLISAGITALIIFGVLHIHNSYNAKTTWEQLR